jgi:hypothetical protein
VAKTPAGLPSPGCHPASSLLPRLHSHLYLDSCSLCFSLVSSNSLSVPCHVCCNKLWGWSKNHPLGSENHLMLFKVLLHSSHFSFECSPKTKPMSLQYPQISQGSIITPPQNLVWGRAGHQYFLSWTVYTDASKLPPSAPRPFLLSRTLSLFGVGVWLSGHRHSHLLFIPQDSSLSEKLDFQNSKGKI